MRERVPVLLTRPMLAGAFQPKYRALELAKIVDASVVAPVAASVVWETPFATLRAYVRTDTRPGSDILVTPPLSGHFSILFRDVLLSLVRNYRVLLLDWANARHVSRRHGAFGLAANVKHVERAMDEMRPSGSVIGLCQGGVAALAAVARQAARTAGPTPRALLLIGSPIDAQAAPTRLVRALCNVPPATLRAWSISHVPAFYAGVGRAVHPAEVRLMTLSMYFARQYAQRLELFRKAIDDDGDDPINFPFLDLYSSVMDLDAAYFIENIIAVYQERALARGGQLGGLIVEPAAIRRTKLVTIEGTHDDVAAPGQTSAAHRLCSSLDLSLRRRVVVSGAGHFSLFHGVVFRRRVVPVIQESCAD